MACYKASVRQFISSASTAGRGWLHSPSVAGHSNHPHMGTGFTTQPETLSGLLGKPMKSQKCLFSRETHRFGDISPPFTDTPSHPAPWSPAEAPQSPAALCVAVAFLDLGRLCQPSDPCGEWPIIIIRYHHYDAY